MNTTTTDHVIDLDNGAPTVPHLSAYKVNESALSRTSGAADRKPRTCPRILKRTKRFKSEPDLRSRPLRT
jgi:hypothetical protein